MHVEEKIMAAGLPFDCLMLVMKILPFKDRVVCESVSRSWNVAARECHATYQTSLCIFSKKENVDKNCIQNFCDDATHQFSFERDCIYANEDNMLPVTDILSKCSNLQALHLKCYEEESLFMDGIHDLASLCPRVEHLSISDDTRGCYIYKDGLTMIQGCDQLKHLQLRFPAESTLDFLIENVILVKSLLMHADTLSNLSTNLPLNNDNCSLIANQCRLQQLFIQGTSTTLEGLTMICTSPTQFLQELCIVIDWDVQLNLISQFLIHLICLRCTIANSDIQSIKCLSSLSKLKKLFLSVWSSNKLDEDMIEIMRGCRQLQSLTVNGEITDTSLVRLGEFCPNMQRLEIALNSDAKGITDRTVEQGLCRLLDLRHLSLRNCDITDAAFRQLFASLPNLCFVRLSVAKNLTLDVIPLLQQYSISHCRRRIRSVLPHALFVPFAERTHEHEVHCPNLVIDFE